MANSSAIRREKKKRQKERLNEFRINITPTASNSTKSKSNIDAEYVQQTDEILKQVALLNPEMSTIISKFSVLEQPEIIERNVFSESERESDEENSVENTVSNKKRRKLEQISLADLKAIAAHPEVIEVEDSTAKYPRLLAQLKCSRNTIPVPKHWSRKRKYLAGKRGFVKPPFDLPQFIKDTGVCEQREALRAIDDAKSLKAKARDRMHPKLGRLAVNYEKLYAAFFKYQTKPPLTGFGELYFEGKESSMSSGFGEGKRRGLRPGILSDQLREALAMTTPLAPPPWLYNMQRFGPPPSYPHLRLPGVNAPLPDGAQWGYHPGGWGRPPMDNYSMDGKDRLALDERLLKPMERNLWGELEPEVDAIDE